LRHDGDKARRETIWFSMVKEHGHLVIDDVVTCDAAADREDSTKVLMANIAASEAEKLCLPP
jgi:hypothetical protein